MGNSWIERWRLMKRGCPYPLTAYTIPSDDNRRDNEEIRNQMDARQQTELS